MKAIMKATVWDLVNGDLAAKINTKHGNVQVTLAKIDSKTCKVIIELQNSYESNDPIYMEDHDISMNNVTISAIRWLKNENIDMAFITINELVKILVLGALAEADSAKIVITINNSECFNGNIDGKDVKR